MLNNQYLIYLFKDNNHNNKDFIHINNKYFIFTILQDFINKVNRNNYIYVKLLEKYKDK